LASAQPPFFRPRLACSRSPMKLKRLKIDPALCTGKPIVRGLRFPVARILGHLAAGQSRDEILASYPYLEAADIDAALHYAVSVVEDECVELQS